MMVDPTPWEFFVVGGTLWRDAPSYIVRPSDDELFKLTLGGEYCNVLAARQMGKSSLMVSTAKRLHEAGVRTAILDISILGGGISSEAAWFFGFLDELSFQLGLQVDVDAWWESHATHNPAQLFTNFLRSIVLVEIRSPIVVFIDEIDSALGMAFSDDFFAAIRAAYNARANQAEYQRLTFVLLGVARPADLIHNRNRTPYNIGTPVHLGDFTLPELHPFQTVFEAVYPGQGREIVEWVLDWTNGQPYLTQKLCGELIQTLEDCCTQDSVAQTVQRLFFTEETRKESNLRAIQDRIESSPYKVKMLQIYAQILSNQPVPDEERSPAKTELKLTGLVFPSPQGQLKVRNRIYRTVFDQNWVQTSLPRTRTRQVIILASLLAILAFIVAGYAIYRQRIQPALIYVEQFQTSNSQDVKLTSLARLLELDSRSRSEALELYSGLSQAEKLSLFGELSSPQNVAEELVTVSEAVYQDNRNNPAGNEILSAMKTVLGRIGAAGAPSLKTEVEFWLKGREEAELIQNTRTAVSFYDSAWAESVVRGHPNLSVRFDRAMALIALESYASALDDLQAVWETDPARQEEIVAAIQYYPALAAFIYENPTTEPAILAFITPVIPSSTPDPTPTTKPSAILPLSPTSVRSPTPSPISTLEQPSPYTGWIALGSGLGTGSEIILLNPINGFQRQITNNGVIDEAPSFSPDNWKLVYTSFRSQSGWELYMYDLRKGTEQQLTSLDGQARFPDWSPVPGDTRIVFEQRISEPEPAVNIWMLDIATGALEQLSSGMADSRPEWSVDGTQILFGRPTRDTTGDNRINLNDAFEIYTLNLATRVEKNLTNTPDFDDFNFTWSPDGERIAYTSVRLDVNGDNVINISDSQDLFVMKADGSNERRLDLEGKLIYTPSWSPDGRFILVVVADEDGQTALWRYDTRNGNFTPLTDPGTYFHPAYSNPP
ncbi:MAG TPA: AAA-like domain-containing protein [Anaerolineales bacterium]|nr:AAA-like domain-containing protein [Anaerolineales bacterium]